MYYMNVVQLFYMFLYVNMGGLLGFYQAYRVETAGFLWATWATWARSGWPDGLCRGSQGRHGRRSSSDLHFGSSAELGRMPIIDIWKVLPSGNLSHNYGKSP